MKKIILSILVLCFAIHAWAHDFTIGVLSYDIISKTEQTVEVFAEEWMSAAYNIPETVSYNGKTYTVVSIGRGAFANRKETLKMVNIPKTVKKIGYEAFAYCYQLKNINFLGEGLVSIDDRAFRSTGIEQFNFPSTLKTIGDDAFLGSRLAGDLVIPDGVTTIGDGAFASTNIKSVTIGRGIKNIPNSAFKTCEKLTSVVISESVETIQGYAFCNCETLQNIYLHPMSPPALEEIGQFDGIPSKAVFYVRCGATNNYMLSDWISVKTNFVEICDNVVVNINTNENGTIIGSGTYKYGDAVTLTAVANDHYHFVRWDDGNTNNPRIITATKDTTLSAEFAIDTHQVIVNVDENGSATGSGVYNYGETITLTATPNAHYHFSKWSDGNTENPRTYVVSQDATLTAEFTIDTHNVVVSGNENGTATGAGIYNYGETITLTATPNAHYHFSKWSDGNTDNPRSYVVTNDVTFTAEFAIDTHNIVVNGSENGSATGSGVYNYGETITLTATPNAHYHFSKWSDGNTDNPRSYVVTNDVTLTAEFAIDTHNIVVNGSENGTVSGVGTYNYGDTVTLNAIPNEGFHFVQWSNGCSQQTLTFIVTEDVTLSAEFSINIYKIVVTANNGAVTGTGTYTHGDSVTITATPSKGYHFVRWSNGSIKNPLTFIATENLTLKAEFSPNTYEIITSAENGTVTGVGTYNYGDVATLTAVANDHYHFVRWSDGNTDNPRVVTVTQDTIFVVEFAVDTHNIVVNGSENGTATGAGIYNYGETITLTATPNAHYHFSKWSDGNTDNPRSYVVTNDVTLTAEFAIDTHNLVVSGSENGSATGSGVYNYGETITLMATPNAHYHFSKWSDGNTDNPRSYVVTNDVTLTAEFAIDTHNIVVNGSENGIVTGVGTYNYGDTVTLSITPNEGYKFVRWSDGKTDNPRTIIVTEDITLGVELELLTYIVSVSCHETHGTVSGSGTYKHGETIVITATANDGFKFAQWNDGDINAQRTLVVTSDTILIATFEEIQCKLTLVSNDPTMGSVFGEGTYKYGTEVSINAVANTGYQFTQWSDNNTAAQRTLTITTDMLLTAYFQPIKYIITATANDETLGMVYGGGEYPYNTSISLMAVPNEGAEFITWTNGVIDNPYIFNVVENVTIQAIFKVISSGVNDIIENDNIATKILRNGQFIIIRDGKTYTVMGQEVK